MKISAIALTLGILSLSPLAPLAGVTETVEDGVRHMKNNGTGVAVAQVTLDEVWRRGSDDDDIIFGLPGQILEDGDGNVYVLDTQVSEIVVFDPSGEYLRTIGRPGEGPGEFRNANDMYLGPDDIVGVVIVFPGKVVQLYTDGEPAGNFRLPQESGEGFQLVFMGRATKDRIVLCGAKQTQDASARGQTNYLKAFDKTGKELVLFHEMEEHSQYGGMKFDEKVWANFKGRWTLAADGSVAAILDFDNYRIHVWNADGSLRHVVERTDYTPLKRPGKIKDRFQKLYDGLTNWSPNSTFKISDTHRALNQVYYREDGSLWALSGRGVWERGDGVYASFDVYNDKGELTHRVELLGEGNPTNDGMFFAGDRLYRVVDRFSAVMAQFGSEGNEETESSAEALQLIAYQLEVPEVGFNR